jgi:hypothetical protein
VRLALDCTMYIYYGILSKIMKEITFLQTGRIFYVLVSFAARRLTIVVNWLDSII